MAEMKPIKTLFSQQGCFLRALCLQKHSLLPDSVRNNSGSFTHLCAIKRLPQGGKHPNTTLRQCETDRRSLPSLAF